MPSLSQTPVIALVGNDACWSQISREQVPILGSNVACGLAFTGLYVAYCTLIATILGISSAHTHTSLLAYIISLDVMSHIQFAVSVLSFPRLPHSCRRLWRQRHPHWSRRRGQARWHHKRGTEGDQTGKSHTSQCSHREDQLQRGFHLCVE